MAAQEHRWTTRAAERTRKLIESQLNPPALWRLALGVLATIVCAHVASVVVGPMLTFSGAMGQHDWDAEVGYRHITEVSLLRYGEMPWWHPYFCGGFPAWGHGEMATNLVSPYLPFYLLMNPADAIRVELVGNTALSIFATWLFVGRFTKNAGLRVLAALAYTINGRYALQIASGHAWHLQYAWTPVALYLFDISVERGRMRMACWAGAALAAIVYMGGIYPLPHTALALTIYALVLSIAGRQVRPLFALAITAITGVGLSAPKLVPIWEVMQRWPRKVTSPEALDLGRLYEMLANPKQTFTAGPFVPPNWAWHEYGVYVGPVVVGCMVLALFGSGNARSTAARATGIVLMCLSLGAFHPRAPWALLHLYSPFSSQHVPSRFAYPAILLMLTAFAAVVGPLVDRFDKKIPWASLLLLLPAWWVGLDIAGVGAVATNHVFFMHSPPHIERLANFVQSATAQLDYTPSASRAGNSLLAMERNEGMVECDNVPDSAKPRGAISRGTPEYRGEAYLAEGPGTAKIVDWTTNRAVVEVAGANPGATVVYNMNWDPGWKANGTPAIEFNHAVAAITTGTDRIEFAYRPRTIGPAMLIFFITLLGIFAPELRQRLRVWREKRAAA